MVEVEEESFTMIRHQRCLNYKFVYKFVKCQKTKNRPKFVVQTIFLTYNLSFLIATTRIISRLVYVHTMTSMEIAQVKRHSKVPSTTGIGWHQHLLSC
jgi:hypothetical protein